jgi:hypothetical protein
MATACAINYSMHPGMIIRYIKGEYVGESRNVPQILKDISSHVNETEATHIERILTQGCPLRLNFEETSEMKDSIIQKGNRATYKMNPEIVTKTMTKEKKHSHVLPVKALGTLLLPMVPSYSPRNANQAWEESTCYI